MQLVIADTGPVNCLILIGHIDILPALFQTIVLPASVRNELMAAPIPVKSWIAEPPSWIEVRQSVPVPDPTMESLDAGEEEAIAFTTLQSAQVISGSILVSRITGQPCRIMAP